MPTFLPVTIGLPEWLGDKEYELAILLSFFLVVNLLVPLVVGFWWRRCCAHASQRKTIIAGHGEQEDSISGSDVTGSEDDVVAESCHESKEMEEWVVVEKREE